MDKLTSFGIRQSRRNLLMSSQMTSNDVNGIQNFRKLKLSRKVARVRFQFGRCAITGPFLGKIPKLLYYTNTTPITCTTLRTGR